MRYRDLLPSVLAFAALVAFASSGCKRSAGPGPEMKTYHLTGTILAKNLQSNEVTIKHGAIPGLMPAMTMDYKVKDPAIVQDVQAGDQVSADLQVSQDGEDYLLENVVITAEPTRDFKPPAPPPPPSVGRLVPDVPMLNQDGKAIRLDEYRGKALVVTFIYTRCPMPTACPRISTHFSKLNALLKRDPAAYDASHLISITLDPAYDKPEVMRRYGLAYTDDQPSEFAHWEFATTSPGDLRKLANAFGLEYSNVDNQIDHTMETTLIGPDGRVVKVWEGSDWQEEDVLDAVKRVEKKSAAGSNRGANRAE